MKFQLPLATFLTVLAVTNGQGNNKAKASRTTNNIIQQGGGGSGTNNGIGGNGSKNTNPGNTKTTKQQPPANNSNKPPPALTGRPCGVGIGPDDNPGAERRSSKARAKFDDLPKSCDDSDTITIELPNGKTKTFQKKRATAAGLGRENAPAFWSGQDEQGNSFNFARGKRGNIAGSFTDFATGDVYQFGTDADGSPVVHTIPSDLFPEEADPEDGGAELDVGGGGARNLLRGAVENIFTENQHSDGRKLEVGDQIDVMVPWTKKAECANSGLSQGCTLTDQTYDAMMTMVELAVFETNQAFINSGVHTQFRLVHAYRDPSYVETSFSSSLSDLRGKTDGKMDNVHALRDQYGADVVAMIIEDPQYCGLGYVGPSESSMFSVTKYSCATGYYTFGHEIGHNMGLLHDRGTHDACGGSGYNYGWRDPNAEFRSIMAYGCKTGQCDNNVGKSCPKAQMFSNIAYTYKGKPIGNAGANNARVLNENKAIVASFRPTKVVDPTCPDGQLQFKLLLTLDNYPQETTWKVTNAAGSTVASGGPYNSKEQKGAEIVFETCLPEALHTFTIVDSWGDGVCCGYGNGEYQVYWDSVLVRSGGAFKSSDKVTFGACVDEVGWKDSYGDGCEWYERYDNPGCPNYGNYWANPTTGITPNQACCHCQL